MTPVEAFDKMANGYVGGQDMINGMLLAQRHPEWASKALGALGHSENPVEKSMAGVLAGIVDVIPLALPIDD